MEVKAEAGGGVKKNFSLFRKKNQTYFIRPENRPGVREVANPYCSQTKMVNEGRLQRLLRNKQWKILI